MAEVVEQLPVLEVMGVIPDGKAMYAALLRNQFLMPPLKDAMVTRRYMLDVKDGKAWCLHSSEVVALKACADCPSRKVLAELVAEAMLRNMTTMPPRMKTAIRRTAALVLKAPPSKSWLVQVLSSVEPGHGIFDTGYTKPAPQRNGFIAPQATVANPNGFFDGIPVAKR